MNTNLKLAQSVISSLTARGVRHIVMCAGSFNSPFFAICAQSQGLTVINHFEERSAAFFALGLSKQLKQAVVICVTSGTAVAECLPAIIEAQYEMASLIVLSGDREKKLSGSGYPQAIAQEELLISHTSLSLDIANESNLMKLPEVFEGPAHLNVRFQEPILDTNFKANEISLLTPNPNKSSFKYHKKCDQINSFLRSYTKPLIILGKITEALRSKIENYLFHLGAPIIAESLSGLRESSTLSRLILKTDNLLRFDPSFDCVVRIGAVPISDLWRALERDRKFQNISVCSISSDARYSGFARPSSCFCLEEEEFNQEYRVKDQAWVESLLEQDRIFLKAIDKLLERYPLSEAAIIHWLSKQIPQESLLYLGNSLPVREWNQFADFNNRGLLIDANRGANGIDGQIASFLGSATASKRAQNWAIIGDLTFLYDCNSLCLAKKIPDINFSLFVINNKGGKIFESLPYYEKISETKSERENFLNQHSFNCANIAQGFGIEAIQLRERNLKTGRANQMVLEFLPCPEQTEAFQKAYSLAR